MLPLAEISCESPVAQVKIHGRTYFLRIFSVSIRRELTAENHQQLRQEKAWQTDPRHRASADGSTGLREFELPGGR